MSRPICSWRATVSTPWSAGRSTRTRDPPSGTVSPCGVRFLSGRTMMMAGHFRRRMVIYPISKRYEDQGRALINWVAELNTADDQPMPRQDWEHTARLKDMLEPFASYAFDFLDVPALIRRAEVIYQYPMVDRDPLPTWNFGQVTLVGDAAHPMYPVGSNGASQAIHDARILAPGAGAPAVDRGGRGRVRRPAPPSYRHGGAGQPPGGSGACMEIVEQRAPDGFTNVDDIVSQQELEEISRVYKRTAGFDPEMLNSRPSLSVR